ncbi:ACP S-malonyltransferase [bacterium]|nr:MAG: ACP S-malonyltransferase [bacterium]QQR61547.1 MAG: ACP S-malonyltransferase [bacterium]QQR62921.1 MAG: ACP S-malonyltransferase [bacterium]
MKVAVVFPGYSGQYVGMGKDFYDNHRFVQEYFEEASSCLNLNFVKLCFASSDAELGKIHNAYPSLFLVSTAIGLLMINEGIIPSVLAGYCDGEFAALSVAKCINLADGLYFLSKYSVFYEDFIKKSKFSALRIMGVPAELLQEGCLTVSNGNEVVFVGICFSGTDHIVSGHRDALERLIDFLHGQKAIKFEHVSIGMGLHSPMMIDIVRLLKMYLEKLDFRPLKTPFVSALNGELVLDGPAAKNLLLRHIDGSLYYSKIVSYLADYDLIIEIGNRVMLHHLLKKEYPEKKIFEVRRSSDLLALQRLIHNQ